MTSLDFARDGTGNLVKRDCPICNRVQRLVERNGENRWVHARASYASDCLKMQGKPAPEVTPCYRCTKPLVRKFEEDGSHRWVHQELEDANFCKLNGRGRGRTNGMVLANG